MHVTGPYWSQVNIESDNVLLPGGTKPSSELMLTQVCVAMTSLGLNELTQDDTVEPLYNTVHYRRY